MTSIGNPIPPATFIDDTVTVADRAWSGQKIQAELTALSAANATNPAPQLSHATINGNEGTSVDVTILNYDASGNTVYSVVSSDETYVTVSRSGAVITVTLVDIDDAEAVSNGERTATVTVSAFDDAVYQFAGMDSIAVTSNRLDVTDAAIQVTDFSSIIASSNDISIVSNKAVSDVDGASLTSNPISQENGEGDWSKAKPTVVLKATDVSDQVTLQTSGTKLFDPDEVLGNSASEANFIDDDDIVKNVTLTGVAAVLANGATVNGSWTATTGTEPDFIASVLGGAAVYSMSMTTDGRHVICTHGSNPYTISIIKLTSRYDKFGDGTLVSQINAATLMPAGTSPASGGTSTVQYAGRINFSLKPDGTKIIGQVHQATSSTRPFIIEFSLSTAFDLSTATIGHALVMPDYNTSADSSEIFCTPFVMPNGLNLIFTPGRMNYAYAYMYKVTMTTAWDLSTAAAPVQIGASSSQMYQLTDMSWDGKRIFGPLFLDDLAAMSAIIIWEMDPLTGEDLVQNTITDGSLANGSAQAMVLHDVWTNQLKAFRNGSTGDEYFQNFTSQLVEAPAHYTYAGATISGDVDYVFGGLDLPALRYDVQTTTGALNSIGQAAKVPENSGAWAIVRDDLQRTVVFAQDPVSGSELEFNISGVDKGMIIDQMKFDLSREYA